MQEQAEKLKSQGLLDKIKMAFQIIGCVLGAICALAAGVFGAMHGNVLMVVGAVMALFSIADQITQLSSGGELGIAQEILKRAQANGSNEMASMISAQVMVMLITVAGAVFSAGLGSSSASMTVAARTLNVGINVFSGINSVISGSVGIASSVVNFEIENLKADSKELEAILMRIQVASELDAQNIEDIMKKVRK